MSGSFKQPVLANLICHSKLLISLQIMRAIMAFEMFGGFIWRTQRLLPFLVCLSDSIWVHFEVEGNTYTIKRLRHSGGHSAAVAS